MTHPKRSDFPCPGLRLDTMNPVRNPLDGKVYDSKSAYERKVRDEGCEIVGNERIPGRTERTNAPGLGEEIKRTYEQMENA